MTLSYFQSFQSGALFFSPPFCHLGAQPVFSRRRCCFVSHWAWTRLYEKPQGPWSSWRHRIAGWWNLGKMSWSFPPTRGRCPQFGMENLVTATNIARWWNFKDFLEFSPRKLGKIFTHFDEHFFKRGGSHQVPSKVKGCREGICPGK